MYTQDHTCMHTHMHTRLVYTPRPHTSHGVAAERRLTDRDCWVIQANMIDFMITLKPQLVFMLSRNAKSFQHKSGRESGMKGTRGRKTLQLLSLQSPPPSLPSSPHSFPLGTFNGIKLWACKSDNNCLGLKHNTLTGLTWAFSPPPLALRCDHLLLLLKNQPQWQAIVVRRHFLCHYLLTHWLPLLSYWHAEKISRSLKVFQEWSLLVVTLMHSNVKVDVTIWNHQ